MNNLDVFNFATMEIFHICLENFPIDVEVEPYDIASAVFNYFQHPESEIEFSEQYENIEQICLHSLWWLRDENYIRLSNQDMDGSCNIVLAEKGLIAVNKVPKVLDNKQSFKDVFYNGLSSLPFSVASGVMTEFFNNAS